MPARPRKVIKKKNSHGLLTLEQQEILLTGTCMEELVDDNFDAFEGGDPEAAYWKHRDFLLAKCQPGTRPNAYWRYEVKERRKLVSGDPDFKHSMIRASGNG
ncbi:unnamed protein product, partial [marine sediment metagenome]